MREQTDLRLGIEADFVPGAEDRMANLLQARDFDYVVGSVHFLREGAVDMDDYSVWDGARSAEEIWRALLPDARRGRAQRAVRHPRPPRPGEVLGSRHAAHRERPLPGGRPAPLLRAGDRRRSPSRASPSRSPRRACASPPARCIRRRRSWRCASKRARRWRSPATPTAPEDVGADYDAGARAARRARASASCACSSGRERRLEPIGDRDLEREVER